MTCESCGDKPKKCNKDFTKAVIEINNPEQVTLMRKVTIPASMGDDTTVPPVVGKYHNVLLYYEANSKSYLYSSDGIPTQLVNGVTDYEAAVNLPQINGVTLLGDKSAADLELADAPMVITVADGNTSWSGADTAEDVYDFFLNKGKVNIVFNGGENYAYEIASAAYIPGEEKMMCTLAVATIAAGETAEFEGNALFGTMTLYTADKAIDVSQIELQPKLYIADFTGLDLNYNELSGVPATNASIGMVKSGNGLEVASDGTLSISDIEQYAHFFDTVADMKAATNLVAGDYARTGGFHTVNDGGGALYKITDTGTANEMDVIAIGSTLYANLITGDMVNILQLGAKANDENYDNQPHLQRTFDLKKTTIIGNDVDDIFWVQSASKFYNSIIFNSWLKNKGSQGREIDRIIYIENVWSDKTIEVINPLIDGNRDTSRSYDGGNNDEYGHGINIRSSQNIKIVGGKIIKCYGDSLAISTSNLPEATRYYSNNILVENVYMDDAYRNTISIISGTNVTIRDCETYNRNGYRDILVEPNEDNRLKNENIVIDGGYHYSNGQTAVIDYCSNRKISNVKVSNCTIENGVNVTCPIRTSNNSTYKTENAIFESITFANHHASTQILMDLGGNVEVKNCKIIGDSNIAYFSILTPTGDVVVDNLYVDVKDSENNSKNFSIVMKAENGVIRFSNNIILSKNSTSGYSTQVQATQAKLVYFVNNYLYKTSNAFGIGNTGGSTQTHDYPTNCVYMINNYVKALDTYPSSRAIIVHYSADVTSLYSNYNFYDGITTKYVLWGDVTNTIGDAFI